ncbi:MAG: ABC transporter ATP-binding protein [Bacteroidales bacterium]|nr:ABC transporter ATP-binding protein [Bacteroidales bacterium]
MKDKTLIKLSNVSAGYSDFIALQNINFEICEHDFIGVIGPNGGGKTTLLKVILGLLEPMKGKIDYSFTSENGHSQLGYLPQVSLTDKKFPITVLEIVLSGLIHKKRLFGKYTKNEKHQALQLLDEVGVAHLARKTIGEISGGQMQRVMLARAIVSSPQVLILDEPNTYVDNKFEHDLYHALKKLNEKMAIVMVSHDIGTISANVKTIACVNKELHYHASSKITQEQLTSYNCPIQLITHGDVPHTVLEKHQH